MNNIFCAYHDRRCERHYGRRCGRRIRQGGFTLIEIMVVVVILGILAALVVPAIMDRPDHARVVRAKQDVRTITNALNMYRLDNLDYPTTLNELATGSSKYLERVPADPWGRSYNYAYPGHRGDAKFDLYSYGVDGTEGGNDLDADIGNWNLDK